MQDIHSANQSGIQAGSSHTTTRLPSDPSPQLPIVLYENDVESSAKPKRRRTEGPKTTISERNRNAWKVQTEMVAQARKLMQVNQPLPPDVRKAYDSYERHKRRSRDYQRNRRAPREAKIDESEEQKTPTPTPTPIVSTSETASTFLHTFSSSFRNSSSYDSTHPLNGTTIDHEPSTSVHTYSSSSSSSSVGNPLSPSSSHTPRPFNPTSIDPQFFDAPPLRPVASHPFDQQLDSDLPQESSGSQIMGGENTLGCTPKVVDIPDNHPRVLIELYERARTKDNNLPDTFELPRTRPVPHGVRQLTFAIDDNDIHSVSAKTTDNITTNDMGRHSEEGFECVVQGARKYRDREEASRISAKSCLDVYVHNLRNTLSDDKLADKFDPADKRKLEAAIDATISWLDASKEEYESKQIELEGLATPIMQRLYATGGAPVSFPGATPKKEMGFLLLRITIN